MGGLTSILTNSDAQRTFYINRMNVIKSILVDAQASNDLKTKVLGYYEYMVSLYEMEANVNQLLLIIDVILLSGKRIKAKKSKNS